MQIVILTAVGVGFSTVIGALLSFFIKSISHRINDAILSFAAGIMLGATFFSLLLPAMTLTSNILIIIAGIAAGAVFINLLNNIVPHLHIFFGSDINNAEKENLSGININKIILFVIAIAIHNLPEGMAVGVSFGGDNIGNAFSIAVGISLQNIPEGLVTIIPLVISGMNKKKAFFIAGITGIVEILGVMIGYLTVSVSSALLPFILSMAGGTMLSVISSEMIPETHSHGYEKTATYSFIIGFIVMIIIDHIF